MIRRKIKSFRFFLSMSGLLGKHREEKLEEEDQGEAQDKDIEISLLRGIGENKIKEGKKGKKPEKKSPPKKKSAFSSPLMPEKEKKEKG